MNKVCVLIRVYNRTEDLQHCVEIIRDTWKLNNYYLLVVSNGVNDGYKIDYETETKVDCLIQLDSNVGHFNGNSQLLLEGLKFIPGDTKYTIILEADTWIYGDKLVDKYIKKLERENAVWASAQFFRYVLNLATDFAIINNDFIKSNQKIFTFSGTPEYYVAQYLLNNHYKFVYITENMPVNLPKYIKRYPYAPTGRFFSFLESKMVTHHTEELKGGMEDKKFEFNAVSRTNYFKLDSKRSYRATRFALWFFSALSLLIPYKGWFVKSKNIGLSDRFVN